jgi:hypothetical protein
MAGKATPLLRKTKKMRCDLIRRATYRIQGFVNPMLPQLIVLDIGIMQSGFDAATPVE